MSNLYRGPSIDASYQVSFHLAKGFQRRSLKSEKLTDDGFREDNFKTFGPMLNLSCGGGHLWISD
jgi:hypothetical protein